MLFIGDAKVAKNGLAGYVIQRAYKDLAKFNNYLTKVDSLRFSITQFPEKSDGEKGKSFFAHQ